MLLERKVQKKLRNRAQLMAGTPGFDIDMTEKHTSHR